MSEMSFDELQQIVSVCLDEIVKLKEDNERLLNAVSSVSKNIVSINETNNLRFSALDASIDNIKYEIFDEKFDKEKLAIPKICDIEKTINELVSEKKSMARFGDGEFAIMSGFQRHGFQNFDEKLSKRLREVIEVNEDGFLIGIGNYFGNLDEYNTNGKREIRAYMTEDTRNELLKYIHMDRLYHNTLITRPYATYADNMTDAPQKRFNDLRKIWDNRNVIFVEGNQTRLGVGNDLFENAASIKRIEAPATNSFSKYDAILSAALSHAEDGVLFLIALGPSAGVLAYDLYSKGHQAIDIGHLDLEYEWFKNGTGSRSEVKTKYNNEYPGGDNVLPVDDEKYLSEIVAKIQ